MPWEPLTTKKEGVLEASRWGKLMKSLMYSSSRGRAGAGSFLFSLCPAFLTALFMKKPGREPLNESLENQHYDAPCAQESPTSSNGLREGGCALHLEVMPLRRSLPPLNLMILLKTFFIARFPCRV